MLLRNAHWILLAVCLLLVYVFYTASDESPTGIPNSGSGKSKKDGLSPVFEGEPLNDDTSGGGMFARLQALKPKLLPIVSKFSKHSQDGPNSVGLEKDKGHEKYVKKPVSPLIMGKNHTRLKTIL